MNKKRILVLYLLIGGLWGLYVLLSQSFSISLNQRQILIVIFFIALYGLVLVSAIAIYKNGKVGFIILFILLLLQIVQIQVDGFGFSFVSGTYFGLEISDNFSFLFDLMQANFLMSFEAENGGFISINVVPIIIMAIYKDDLLYFLN